MQGLTPFPGAAAIDLENHREVGFEGRVVASFQYRTEMEHLKNPLEQLEPDPRSSAFVKMDATRSEAVSMTVEDFHQWAQHVNVSDHVPEDVRSYVETIKNLFVFGWYHYPFCTLAAFLATTGVEMALRRRYPRPEPDRRSFSRLLRRAEADGLLADKEFATLAQRRADMAAMLDAIEGQVAEATQPPFAEIICSSLPRIRNDFAHPGGHWIMPPGPALDMLILCAEVINAVWDGSATARPSPLSGNLESD